MIQNVEPKELLDGSRAEGAGFIVALSRKKSSWRFSAEKLLDSSRAEGAGFIVALSRKKSDWRFSAEKIA